VKTITKRGIRVIIFVLFFHSFPGLQPAFGVRTRCVIGVSRSSWGSSLSRSRKNHSHAKLTKYATNLTSADSAQTCESFHSVPMGLLLRIDRYIGIRCVRLKKDCDAAFFNLVEINTIQSVRSRLISKSIWQFALHRHKFIMASVVERRM